jgi:hypothetical protein
MFFSIPLWEKISMNYFARLPVIIVLLLLLPYRPILNVGYGQKIDSSPSRSVQLFFAAVSDHDFDAARKFLPRSIFKKLESEFPGGFRAFIEAIAAENEGSRLEIQSESIEEGKAKVDTITVTASGKRISEKWILRLEDSLWKLNILIPR